MNQKKGQVWVETAIYMLIGLSIIAIVLSVATPQLQKMKEKGVVRQTIEALNSLNKEILEIENSPGSRRIIQFKLTQGKLIINPEHKNITYVLGNTGLKLTEPGVEVKEGDLYFLTEEYGKNYKIWVIMRLKN
jgi:type II secretory pathway pseudopilin PulG